jgi:Nucleotide-diphospho-sugar transferase/Methyltransferase domain
MLPVVISSANFGYMDFARNLLANVRETLSTHRFVFYCMDQQLYNSLKGRATDRIEIRLFDTTCDTGFQDFDSAKFIGIDRAKIQIIRSALSEFGFVHFVDADVVFFKEPTAAYHAEYADYDIVYQRDMAPSMGSAYDPWTCVGNMTLRNTESTRTFLDTLQEYETRYPEKNDQECQRQMFRDAGISDIRMYPHAKLTEFPMEHFTMGWVVSNQPDILKDTMVFHANYVVGKDAKMNRLKQVGKWYANKLCTYYHETVDANDAQTGGWSKLYYGVLSKVINENKFARVAEIGIGYGTHAKQILKTTNVQQLYLVDPMVFYGDDAFATNVMSYEANTPGNNFNEFADLIRNELSPWKDRYTWFRQPSLSITNDQIADGSLDCVFVDGDHSYAAVAADLDFWWKKVRPGGQMLGDDYWMGQVAQAVNDFAQRNKLTFDFLYRTGTDYKIFRFYK